MQRALPLPDRIITAVISKLAVEQESALRAVVWSDLRAFLLLMGSQVDGLGFMPGCFSILKVMDA